MSPGDGNGLHRKFEILRVQLNPGGPVSGGQAAALKQVVSEQLGLQEFMLASAPEIIVLLNQSFETDARIDALRHAINDEFGSFGALMTERATVNAAQLAALLSGDEPSAETQADGVRPEAMWMPVWDVRKEALTSYWLTPVISATSSPVAAYDRSWALSRAPRAADFLGIDLGNAAQVVEQAERSFDANLQSSLSYSVHATTLQHRDRRRAFLECLYEAPVHLRSRLLGFIAEIEPGTPPSLIAEWVGLLLPVTSEVAVQLHAGDAALESVGETGAATAGFLLPAAQGEANVRDQYARHIQRWAGSLRRQHVAFRLDNIHDPALLSLALPLGVNFLTGDRFWPHVQEPAGVRRFPRSQIGQSQRS